MGTINLLYKNEYVVTDKVKVMIPTVGQIIEKEDTYYELVAMLTAMPIDMMVQLDDLGINFTEINEFELFLIFFAEFIKKDTSLIFGDLNTGGLSLSFSEQNGAPIIVDADNNTILDRLVYNQVAETLRKIHSITKNRKRPANDEARKYMLKRAREKIARNKNRSRTSELEDLIVAMVSTEQYHYDIESTKALTIYQFNRCVHQIVRKIDYDNQMHGVYAGTVSAKDLSQDDLNWLKPKAKK